MCFPWQQQSAQG